MAFTDDLLGQPRARQIARIHAAAAEDGVALDDDQVIGALEVYASLAADPGDTVDLDVPPPGSPAPAS